MKQVYSQVDVEGTAPLSHDYDLDEGYLFTTLKYSGSGNWGDQLVGTVAGSIQDTGDDLIIKVNGVKQLKLDYLQAQQILILLLSNNQEKIEIRESKLIKSI
jgi:hypothetical protein